MQEDFVFRKNNSFPGFATSYLGKRLRFVIDLYIDVEIDLHWKANTGRQFLI